MHSRVQQRISHTAARQSLTNHGKGYLWKTWALSIRLLAGVYWLYFSSQKWFDSSWVKPLLDEAAATNRIPPIQMLLSQFVVPNWRTLTVAQTAVEALIGILLIVGLLTRIAGFLGAAVNLSLLISFTSILSDPAVSWFYVLSATMNVTVAVVNAGHVFGMDGVLASRRR